MILFEVVISQGVIRMDNMLEPNGVPRKEWAAPELKKIDIEEITAGGSTSPGSDSFSGYS
jgi:hypothetical protein